MTAGMRTNVMFVHSPTFITLEKINSKSARATVLWSQILPILIALEQNGQGDRDVHKTNEFLWLLNQ